MCHYITASLPQSVDTDSVAPIFESHKLGFDLISNPHVSAQLEAGDLYLLTTRSHCDCGTALGSLSVSAAPDELSYERELKKFRNQGWSEAKINRWLEQKRQTKARHLREDEARAKGSTHELNQWIRLITEVLQSGSANRVGLLLHMYHGSIESERITILRREKVKLAELTPELLMRIKEDVVYELWFSPYRHPRSARSLPDLACLSSTACRQLGMTALIARPLEALRGALMYA